MNHGVDKDRIINGIRKIILNVISNYPTMPPVLYHYTNSNGLLGILSTGIMKATHFLFMNDHQEYLHSVSLFKDSVTKNCDATVDPTHKLIGHHLRHGLEITRLHHAPNLFVACFSEEDDSLSQWRAYGGGEGGFALGFASTGLVAQTSAKHGQFHRCLYEASQKTQLTQAAWDFVCADFAAQVAPVHLNVRNDFAAQYVSALFDVLAQATPLFKDKAFAGEREWRIVWSIQKLAEVNFAAKPTHLSGHVDISLAVAGKMPLTEVVIGPARHADLSAHALSGLLVKHGYQLLADSGYPIPGYVKIRRSAVPFRSL